MTTAALDANTIVSATIVPVGISAQILDAAAARHFTLITSGAIVTEVTRVLGYPRIQRKYHISPAGIERVRSFLQRRAVLTPITVEIHGVATHSEDDLVLATAVSAQADYLVTGDTHLQKLRAYGGVTIVSPREFLMVLESQPPTS
ncbi:MAG: putative toxin-antitoxin system toxin component, PIN family [Chloroflexi bacterium]|nr:putative toxin-antitoxin system toxin component, PIN family [Chloroflexota bacterium]